MQAIRDDLQGLKHRPTAWFIDVSRTILVSLVSSAEKLVIAVKLAAAQRLNCAVH